MVSLNLASTGTAEPKNGRQLLRGYGWNDGEQNHLYVSKRQSHKPKACYPLYWENSATKRFRTTN